MTEPTVAKTETIALKTCPICASPGHVYAKQGRSKGWYDVGCTKFGCIYMNQSFRSAEEAAEAWNRRVNE